jgi:hypothetical protein
MLKYVASRIVVIAIFFVVAWISFDNYYEAFGPGPPYYSQTTNMDKWADPTGFIILCILGAIVLSAPLLYFIKRP